MTDKFIKDCPSCGGKVEADWGGVTEMTTGSFQQFDIMCDNIYCEFGINVNVNVDGYERSNIEEIMIDAWNKILIEDSNS